MIFVPVLVLRVDRGSSLGIDICGSQLCYFVLVEHIVILLIFL